MRMVAPDDSGFCAAVDALKSDCVVAYPTETVYGLAVDPFSDSALDALYMVKARDPNHPVLILIGSMEQLTDLTGTVPESAEKCMNAFWPGPLSLLVARKPTVPVRLANADDRICVRLSPHPIATRLAREFGRGITSTSANVSGAPPALSPDQVPQDGVAVCIDGGACAGTKVSTVYDSESDRILREGAITRGELDQALGNS